MYDPKLQTYAPWLNSHSLIENMGQSVDLVEDSKGRIWATGNNGLYMIEPKQQSITSFPLPEIIKSPGSLITTTAIERGPADTLWVGTSAGNLLQFSISEMAFIEKNSLPNFSASWVTDIAHSANRLWVATDNGLIVVAEDELSSMTFTHSNSSLSSDDTLCLLASQDFMWVGTSRGLNIFSSGSFEKFQNTNSNVFNDVLSFTESSNEGIWIGTFDGVYYLGTGSQTHISIETAYKGIKLTDRRVMTMAIRNDELWLGFFLGGVQIVDLGDGTTRLPNLPHNAELAVTKIAHLQDGSTLVGTFNQGLFRHYQNKVESLYGSLNTDRSIPELAVTLIFETSDNSVIVGAETQLYWMDFSANSVRALQLLFRDKKTHPVVLSLAQSQKGDVWVGTQDQGLFIWHYQKNPSGDIQLEFAAGNSALPSSTIYAIEFDEKGYGWISTTRGISKLDSNGEHLKNYKEIDGLQGHDFNFSSSFKDSQGRLYFGGSNGYNRFDPDRDITAAAPPPVVLTRLNIAGKEPTLPVALHKLESIELSYRDYFITFTFSVLDYRDPENNRYRYKLDNFDPNWIENGTRNSATYTNLPPGTYTFRVQGANSAGVWNLEGTSIEMTVHPAPWWSWQAYLLYFSLVFALLMLAKKYYDNSVLRKKSVILAQQMYDAADKATDDLQEQLEYQDEFVKSVHAHSTSTLKLIGDFIAQQANSVDDDLARDAILNNTDRVAALSALEECLFYQGDQLLANLEDYSNIVIDTLLKKNPVLARSITTINEISSRLIPVDLATPLSIIIFELLKNSFQHAFENSSSANYIHIRMEDIPGDTLEQDTMTRMSVQDNGVGMPANIQPGTGDTSGLAIANSISRRIDAELTIAVDGGTTVYLLFSRRSNII